MTAVSFYTGHVTHRRFADVNHRLRYRIAYVLVDLDRLPEANEASFLLGAGRGGIMSVKAKDHGDGKTGDLAAWARTLLHESGVEQKAARIELLTLPRMYGFVFNPISVYFIYDNEGALHHVLYEVNNTFGERRFYLCPAEDGAQIVRHDCAKTLYVSPFLDVNGRYRFSLRPPGDTLALRIHYDAADHPKALTAMLAVERKPVTNWTAMKIILGFPLMTLGVVAAIHWEALKLLVKGVRYRPHRSQKAHVAAFQITHANNLTKIETAL
ncbi:MAG: DUF1365 domain-containing protein [Parvularculaceae bacterium]